MGGRVCFLLYPQIFFPGFEAGEMGGADPSRPHAPLSERIAGIHDSSLLVGGVITITAPLISHQAKARYNHCVGTAGGEMG
jgi:hypothetical protein